MERAKRLDVEPTKSDYSKRNCLTIRHLHRHGNGNGLQRRTFGERHGQRKTDGGGEFQQPRLRWRDDKFDVVWRLDLRLERAKRLRFDGSKPNDFVGQFDERRRLQRDGHVGGGLLGDQFHDGRRQFSDGHRDDFHAVDLRGRDDKFSRDGRWNLRMERPQLVHFDSSKPVYFKRNCRSLRHLRRDGNEQRLHGDGFHDGRNQKCERGGDFQFTRLRRRYAFFERARRHDELRMERAKRLLGDAAKSEI